MYELKKAVKWISVLQSERHSVQSNKLIKRSLIVLFIQVWFLLRDYIFFKIQLCIPFLLYIVPTVGIFLGLMIEDLITFGASYQIIFRNYQWHTLEFSLTLFLLLPWHSIGHNIILLTITSVYRKRIVAILHKLIPFHNMPVRFNYLKSFQYFILNYHTIHYRETREFASWFVKQYDSYQKYIDSFFIHLMKLLYYFCFLCFVVLKY